MIKVPAEINAAMDQGAALVISVSGGKDSQAILNEVSKLHRERGWRGDLVVVHADLGRIEWTGTGEHVRKTTEATGLPLYVVSAGDMVDRWKRRMKTLEGTGKPFWSSSAHRYCTSDMKRTPIDAFLRRYRLVVSVDGIRAQESPARAKKPVLSVRAKITAERFKTLTPENALRSWRNSAVKNSTSPRLALDWHAIHDWTIDRVWEACGTSAAEVALRRRMFKGGDHRQALEGFPAHHAYVRGNERLSCSMCVLATDNDIRNGAQNRPDVARELVQMERTSGFTFKNKKSLASIIEGVLLETIDHTKKETP